MKTEREKQRKRKLPTPAMIHAVTFHDHPSFHYLLPLRERRSESLFIKLGLDVNEEEKGGERRDTEKDGKELRGQNGGRLEGGEEGGERNRGSLERETREKREVKGKNSSSIPSEMD